MKAVLIAFVVAIICIASNAEVSMFNVPVNNIIELKAKVKKQMEEIVPYRTSVKSDFVPMVRPLISSAQNTFNNAMQRALNDLETTVKAFKTEGRDVEHCYTTAKTDIAHNSKTFSENLQKCHNATGTQIKNRMEDINKLIAEHEALMANLEKSLKTCFSMEVDAMNTCLEKQRASGENALQKLTDKKAALQFMIKLTHEHSYTEFRACTSTYTANGTALITKLEQTAIYCMITTM